MYQVQIWGELGHDWDRSMVCMEVVMEVDTDLPTRPRSLLPDMQIVNRRVIR